MDEPITHSMILARSTNGVIGCNNDLPWKLPNDLARFKKLTYFKVVVMGRKTFDSLNRKPLEGRVNVVISKNSDIIDKSCATVHEIDSVDRYFKLCENVENMLSADGRIQEHFFIGGSQIFQEALPRVSRVYLTEVHAEIEGDVFFDHEFDPEEWVEVSREFHKADEQNEYNHSFVILERR